MKSCSYASIWDVIILSPIHLFTYETTSSYSGYSKIPYALMNLVNLSLFRRKVVLSFLRLGIRVSYSGLTQKISDLSDYFSSKNSPMARSSLPLMVLFILR